MNEKEEDKFEKFFPERKPENYSIEIPAEQRPLENYKIPSGYDPMGEIDLRGRVYQGLGSGRVHWWVLITAWVIFGGYALTMLYVAIVYSSFKAWVFLAMTTIPLLILWRGTKAKLFHQKRRAR